MTTSPLRPDPGVPPRTADALRLLVLVRRRRRLRRTLVLSLLALPLWVAAVVVTQAVAPEPSPLWDAAGEWATPGLEALAALALVALVGLLAPSVSRRADRRAAAHLARRIAPLFGRSSQARRRGRAVTISGDHAAAAAFTSVVDRRPKLGYGLLTWFVGSVLLTLATAWQVPSVWQANHGGGGRTYTFGVDASLDHTEPSRSGTDYFLATPEGVTISQSGRPQRGEQFVVTPSGAYAVGGHTWVLVGGIAVAGGLTALVSLLALAGGWVRESVRRDGLPHPDPAVALETARSAARAGRPVELQWAAEPAVRLSFDRLAELPAERVLARHRRHVVVGTAGVLVLVGGGATLAATGAVTPRPDSGDVQLPALAGVVPDGRARVHWSGQGVDPGLFTSLVGTAPAGRWDVDLAEVLAAGPHTFATVSVYRLPDGVPAATAQGRWTTFLTTEASGARVPMTGLPQGWTGVLRGDGDGRTGEAVVAQGPWLLDVDVTGMPPSAAAEQGVAATTDDQLAAGTRAVAAALAADGVDRFAAQTAR